jgi:type IX secretion system PorP/SprF family membrane protein
MRKYIFSIIILMTTKNFGQELNLPVFTQYLAENNFVVSPTFAGIGDNLRIRVNGLTQWVGVKNAPDNASLYADMRVTDNDGVGIALYADKNGFTKQSGIKLSWAHHIILDYYSSQYLSFGLSFNINNFRIDTDKFNIGFDQGITDDRFNSNNNFDLGILYRKSRFYFSFNASNILPKNLDKFRGVEPRLLRNFQGYSGYIFKANDDSGLEVEPSLFYQFFQSDRRSSTDVNLKIRKVMYNDDYYWAGISYRFLNDQAGKPLNIGPMFGAKVGKFFMGYAYQVTTNEFIGYNSGTHILTLGLDFFQGISDCPCTQHNP